MEDSLSTAFRHAEDPLPPEAQARLDQFKAFALRHPILDDVETQLLHAIWEPAGFAYVIVFGPSGVGKSTMMEYLVKRFNAARASSFGSLLLTEARPPEGELFDRTDYYRTTFQKLGIHTQSPSDKRGWGRTSARYHEEPALRNALEETLRRERVRAVVLDEAQHLMKASNGAKPLDQLDWIKGMTNVSGVLHILLGTYDLLHFCNLNGQTARRGLEIHFPRYDFQQGPELEAFQTALLTLLRQLPLRIDEQALMDHWWDFYKRSIGCVGVLKQWLVRATALALREENESLTWTHVEKRALSDAKCAQMAADVKDGEDELRYSAETHRERLKSLFGTSNIPVKTGVSFPQSAFPASPAASADENIPVDLSHKTAKGRVGERAPSRDPVGETRVDSTPSTCSFKGLLDLTLTQMRETTISRVECPECLTVRSLNAKGSMVKFPSHSNEKRVLAAQKNAGSSKKPCGLLRRSNQPLRNGCSS